MDTLNFNEYHYQQQQQQQKQSCSGSVASTEVSQPTLWDEDKVEEARLLVDLEFLSLDTSDAWSTTLSTMSTEEDQDYANLQDFEEDEFMDDCEPTAERGSSDDVVCGANQGEENQFLPTADRDDDEAMM